MEPVDLLDSNTEGEVFFVRLQFFPWRGASSRGGRKGFRSGHGVRPRRERTDVRKATVARFFGYLKTRYFA
ncbi:hypothetical protein ACULMH_07175 [Xanthomonas arboricola pv. corylina]|uniref:hypothetical protein n=1 Tax=Xanthomonas arboricola TaxID=56448 RepID=UPI0040409BA3